MCAALLRGASVALIVASPGSARDLASAEAAYDAQQFDVALANFKELAEFGLPHAQHRLAIMYARGEGIRPQRVLAYAWASLARDAGREAAAALADHLEANLTPTSRRIADEIRRDFAPDAIALRWLSPAAQSAQSKCDVESLRKPQYPPWNRELGLQGTVVADFQSDATGRTTSVRVALSVPSQAFDSGIRRALLATRWQPRQEDADSGTGCHSTLVIRFVIQGLEAEAYAGLERSLEKHRQLAEQGDPRARISLGLALLALPQVRGDRTDRPRHADVDAQAMRWFREAAQAGEPAAQYMLGLGIATGWGGEENVLEGRGWMFKAAQADQPEAQVAVAAAALDRERPSDRERLFARIWLQRAARTESVDARLMLAGLSAANPDAAERDPAKALELLAPLRAELKHDPTWHEIKAAASAASGDFEAARRAQREAQRASRSLDQDTADIDARLSLYERGVPWYGLFIPRGAVAAAPVGSAAGSSDSPRIASPRGPRRLSGNSDVSRTG